MHPSIKKAREMLARRDASETDFAIWSAEHADELDDIASKARHDAFETRRSRATVIRKISVDKSQTGLEFVLSDATQDRMGDVIEPSGWDLADFRKNPIALFSHDPLFVVGTWDRVGVRQNSLRGHLNLAPLGTSSRINEVIKLVKANVIRAVSVGFRPIESTPLPNGGLRFVKSALIECSLVSTPANPNALAVARGLNVSPETLRMVFDSHRIDNDEPATPLDALADEIGVTTGKMQREIKALRAEVAKLKAAK